MITAPVRVISAVNGTAQVQATAQSGCGGCQSRESCGVSGIGKYFSGTRKSVQVQCDTNVRVGDEIQLCLSEGDLIKAGLLAYLIPSVLALVGAGAASAYGLDDAAAALCAANGMALGFLLVRFAGWTPGVIAQRKEAYFSKGDTA